MPLDGHAHLVSQGWSGKGSGLRSGAIAKPINIIQKKSLAGVGKDRDEAFPFWDHVFQAASVSIQVKVHNSDDESDSEGCSTPNLALERTKTGIISNRRPTTGTPALSGATTPSEPPSLSVDGTLTPRLSIMAQAKQQSARRMLYAMFFRGPVLSTDDVEEATSDSPSLAGPSSSSSPISISPDKTLKEAKTKKRKVADVESEDKTERKRRKREAKAETRSKLKGKEKASDDDEEEEAGDADVEGPKAAKAARKAERKERKERKRLRAEKRARKEERRKKRTARKAKGSAEADSTSDEEPTEIEESLLQVTTPGAEGATPPVARDVEKALERTGDSSEDTSSKEKSTKKKRSKKS